MDRQPLSEPRLERTGIRLELLLILSALLTGLTGAFTGDRARAPVQSAGVEATASAKAEEIVETAVALLQQNVARAAHAVGTSAALPWARNPSFVRSIIGASERRLE